MKTEFDDYANNYYFGCDNYLKRLLGSQPDDFLKIKINWLKTFFKYNLVTNFESKINILDYGCGNGLFLKKISELNLQAHLSGVEISEGMLDNAKTILSLEKEIDLWLIPADEDKLPIHHFEVIILSSVLHHIDPKHRPALFLKIEKLLTTNGLIIIFEHNPLNPLTKWVVKNTIIDKNAVLLKPQEIANYIHATHNLRFLAINYLMFFPPRFNNPITRFFENRLKHVSYGAQYVAVIKKSAVYK